jgi:dihydroflavonol-4-reductase
MNDGQTVITGAAGHIGANLARSLIQSGRRVRLVVHQDTRAIDELAVDKVKADVLDVSSLKAAFEGVEVVYHLAAHISFVGGEEALVQRINVEGTRNVVEACLVCGVKRLVHFSSIHALSQYPTCKPIDEENALADGNGFLSYDRSKAAGERAVLEGIARGLDAVIVNPTAVLGPHDYKPSAMGEVLIGLARGRFIALVEGGFDWVDVRDVVAGALAAEKRGRCGERYLLGGSWCSVADLARLVQGVSGTKAPSWISPTWLARIGAPFVVAYSRLTKKRPLYTSESLKILTANNRVSHDKAASELEHRPRSLESTVKDTYDWFKMMRIV